MIWRRRIARAWQLIRARRFVRIMVASPPMPPGSIMQVPGGVVLQDVCFWHSQLRLYRHAPLRRTATVRGLCDMTEETAKQLAEAMNRLAAALEALRSPGMISGGIQVYHHGFPTQQFPQPHRAVW